VRFSPQQENNLVAEIAFGGLNQEAVSIITTAMGTTHQSAASLFSENGTQLRRHGVGNSIRRFGVCATPAHRL
jgi:hypothetical protein